MKAYELMVIYDPSLDEDSQSSALDKTKEIISSEGGTVGEVDIWGKRKLAFEIADNTEGIYAVITFQASPEGIAELDRVLRITDRVVRHMITRREHAA